jgi:hypothetical protein
MDNDFHALRTRSNEYSLNRSSSIRDIMERRSTFYQLNEETKQLQKMVSKLEAVLKGDGQSKENAWRVRVLLKTAQDADKNLWTKLYEFEKTLLSNINSSDSNQTELREEQTACLKLHRDFKRTHKALLMCLSLAEKPTSPTTIAGTELSSRQLRAVGWTGKKVEEKHEEQEFVHNTLRPVSPDPTYTSFQEVKQELMVHDYEHDDFAVVQESRRHIDEDDIRYVAVEVDSPVEESQCYERYGYLCGAMGCDGFDSKAVHWYKKVEEEFALIQQGILRLGKSLDCGATEGEYAKASSRFVSSRQASF